MANYNQLKNAAILTPTSGTDLGSDANRYSNVYMSGNIVMSNGVTVTSTNVITPKISSLTLPGTETAVDIAGGETITINGTGFSTGASVLLGSTPAPTVTYIDSTRMSFTTPALSAGTYVLYAINTDGGTATYIPGISFSGTPNWTTAAGSLGTAAINQSASFTVAATGDAPVTYSLKTGSLPSGLSLNTSTGAITGTTPSLSNDTNYNFTLTAKDLQNQTTDRAFSISILVAVAPTAVEYLVVAGGGGGGAANSNEGGAGGGGAGGYRTATGYSVSVGSPITITIGGGAAYGTGNGNGSKGSDSIFGTITSTGGGFGAGASGSGGGFGGSGGGGHYSGGGTGNSPSTTPSQGNSGGSGYLGGDYGGGGGGGAGAVGESKSSLNPSSGGNGGAGLNWNNLGTYYAGGGGGSCYTGTAGTGGSGIGGNGKNNSLSGQAGLGATNTGSGGGAGLLGGNGGSGVVIIRYSTSYTAAASTTGSPTVTTASGYRYYTFNASGTITF